MLLDYRMPFKNGHEVIAILKKLFLEPKDLLIEPKYAIVTAHDQPKFLKDSTGYEMESFRYENQLV